MLRLKYSTFGGFAIIASMTVERSTDGIDYTLRRNRGQRSLRLHLDSHGHVIVSAPYYASYSEIDDFVRRSASWIADHSSRIAEHNYQSGDVIPYLGRRMTLLVLDGKTSQYDIVDDKIIVTVKNKDIELVKKTIKKLYVDTVMDVLERRVPYWCSELDLEDPSFGVNRAKGKWGVCYPVEKRLYLSYMCATLPYDLMDMTVLHEVCHLRYAGHGADFWGLMKFHMPDLEERKTRLNKLSKAGWSLNIV